MRSLSSYNGFTPGAIIRKHEEDSASYADFLILSHDAVNKYSICKRIFDVELYFNATEKDIVIEKHPNIPSSLKSLQDDIVYIEFSNEIPQYEIIGLSNIERWFKENGNEIFTLHLPAIPIEDVYFQFRTGKREMRKESSVIQEKVYEISEKQKG